MATGFGPSATLGGLERSRYYDERGNSASSQFADPSMARGRGIGAPSAEPPAPRAGPSQESWGLHQNILKSFNDRAAAERDPDKKAAILAQSAEVHNAYLMGQPYPDFAQRALQQQQLGTMAGLQGQAIAAQGAAATAKAAQPAQVAQIRADGGVASAKVRADAATAATNAKARSVKPKAADVGKFVDDKNWLDPEKGGGSTKSQRDSGIVAHRTYYPAGGGLPVDMYQHQDDGKWYTADKKEFVMPTVAASPAQGPLTAPQAATQPTATPQLPSLPSTTQSRTSAQHRLQPASPQLPSLPSTSAGPPPPPPPTATTPVSLLTPKPVAPTTAPAATPPTLAAPLAATSPTPSAPSYVNPFAVSPGGDNIDTTNPYYPQGIKLNPGVLPYNQRPHADPNKEIDPAHNNVGNAGKPDTRTDAQIAYDLAHPGQPIPGPDSPSSPANMERYRQFYAGDSGGIGRVSPAQHYAEQHTQDVASEAPQRAYDADKAASATWAANLKQQQQQASDAQAAALNQKYAAQRAATEAQYAPRLNAPTVAPPVAAAPTLPSLPAPPSAPSQPFSMGPMVQPLAAPSATPPTAAPPQATAATPPLAVGSPHAGSTVMKVGTRANGMKVYQLQNGRIVDQAGTPTQ